MQQLLVSRFSYKPKVRKIDPQEVLGIPGINHRNSPVTEKLLPKVVTISSILMLKYHISSKIKKFHMGYYIPKGRLIQSCSCNFTKPNALSYKDEYAINFGHGN